MPIKNFLLIVAVATAILFAHCKKDKFVKETSLCPLIISTNPLMGATGMPVNQTITASFNEKIDPATVTDVSFSLNDGSIIPGIVSYTDSTASFNPIDPMDANTAYTARITTAIKDLMGNRLQADYLWSFSTGSIIAPFVTATSPVNNATGVALNKVITARFSNAMDGATLNTNTVFLKAGTTSISGSVSYSDSTVSFLPSTNLLSNTIYTATIKAAAKNLAGTPLVSDYVWTFRTGTLVGPVVVSADPINGATNVALNKVVTASFSVAMNPTTINTNTFTIRQNGNLVAGTISYSGTTASFTPSSALLPNLVYNATITTGARNIAGTPLAGNYSWSFSTITVLFPTVVSTDPMNIANNVALNKDVSATFSEPMDVFTLSNLTFTVRQGSNPVSGAITYSGNTVKFNPNNPLISDATYTATITTGAKNIAGVPLANNYVWNFTTIGHAGAPNVVLGSVAAFGIIAGAGVSNNAGFSVINNLNVGISPGIRSSITGFPPAVVVNGAIYASDDIAPPGVAAMLLQAKLDLTNAYLFVESASFPAPVTVSGDIGGLTLAPGIYKSTSTLMIQSGDLTLDAQGDANAVWIFQVAAGFTTVGGAGGSIILTGGAKADNVFWQTGSSAVIGDYTSFKGNVLALTSITMNPYAVATGRMLARNGSVVMTHTNIINKP